MRRFKSNHKNILYFLFRLISPLFNPIKFYTGIIGYPWYVRDLLKYNSLAKDENNKVRFNTNLYPILDEKISFTPFDAHYFHQQLWLFEHVMTRRPEYHVDVASTYEMSGYLSKIVKAKFVDIRPIDVDLDNLEVIKGDILNLPFPDKSVESLSSLNVIEHIGLGRYGDPVDPEGIIKACVEMQRVLAKNGTLYVSTPIGSERLCFNAHRVSNPEKIISYFTELTLVSFSVVDDEGKLRRNVQPSDYTSMNYSCGFFELTRK